MGLWLTAGGCAPNSASCCCRWAAAGFQLNVERGEEQSRRRETSRHGGRGEKALGITLIRVPRALFVISQAEKSAAEDRVFLLQVKKQKRKRKRKRKRGAYLPLAQRTTSLIHGSALSLMLGRGIELDWGL